jgi:hypothetical protein
VGDHGDFECARVEIRASAAERDKAEAADVGRGVPRLPAGNIFAGYRRRALGDVSSGRRRPVSAVYRWWLLNGLDRWDAVVLSGCALALLAVVELFCAAFSTSRLIGGPDAVSNLQWHADARAKDRWERRDLRSLRRSVPLSTHC